VKLTAVTAAAESSRARHEGGNRGQQVLQFLSQRPGRDLARLAASLGEFVGHPAYGLDELRNDLERFGFLFGGSHGEPLRSRASSRQGFIGALQVF
jgi:hypothetical protein